MNKTHAVIWNASKACWTVASECARRRGKSGVTGARLVAAALAAAGLTALAPSALAGPTGGKVTHGNAAIWQNATDTIINQSSSKAVIDWQSFDVNGNERVTFNQMSANDMTLNYVSGLGPQSSIRGSINALGKVFLVNPNGIVFGAGAQVNVGGLVASARAIDPVAFMNNANGVFAFDAGAPSSGRVENYGTIRAAAGGEIALLGAHAVNYGTLQADGGSVALGGGQTFTLRMGNGPLSLEISAPFAYALASNAGVIRANGGQVALQARRSASASPYETVVNNNGVIEAKTLNNRSGRIVLDGGDRGLVQVAGSLNASALASYGNGGTVDVMGEHVAVRLATQVDTRAINGSTGTFRIRSTAVNVENVATTAQPTIHADTLTHNLATTNIELRSTAGDVVVNAPIAWASGNALTLDARHGGAGKVAVNGALTATGGQAALNLAADERIDINNKITLSGLSNRLSLETSTPAPNAGPHMAPTANYVLGGAPGQAVITLSGANAGFASNGVQYTVIQNLAQMQAVSNNLYGYYVLGTDLRGSGTFQSIGGQSGVFNGSFEGLGHTLSSFSVSSSGANAGLFAASAGVIRDLNLDAIGVSSGQPNLGPMSIGTLVGDNTGRIANVKVANTTLYGNGYRANATGGLAGTNRGGTIENSSFSGRVYGGAQTYALGGLVGINTNGNSGSLGIITGSRSEGIVSGSLLRHDAGGIGGLAGANLRGQISDSLTTAAVTASSAYVNTGGAVGLNQDGIIERVSSTGAVSGNAQASVGGLVGKNLGASGAIAGSTSTGRVSSGAGSNTGGLVGENTGSIRQSEASGEVVAYNGASTGGLVGLNGTGGALADVKASGIVRDTGAASSIGGLVGANGIGASIDNGEASGALVNAANSNANTRAGGLAGQNSGTIAYSTSRVLDVRAGNNASVGGLVGFNQGMILASGSSSRAQGGAYSNVGGIAGQNAGAINIGMAWGSVAGGSYSNLGGIAGVNHSNSRIQNSTASGPVIGAYNCSTNGSYCYTATGATLGGLAGVNYGWIDNSIAAGMIDYRNNAGQIYGGLVGVNYGVMQGNLAQGHATQVPPAGINYGVMDPPYYYF
ncbi:MAG: filamentous hemagglutinin N-terminal domain-containing protein [Achromobacter sp.]|uniref:two-partner secretion domain-containing protein n=1 Tax=Achromobacter sp. TaxID=134375 RepID=UPI00258C21A0|nr:GLUG motif-containing protein [Achromobacter sp.]MCW0205644.1 filamentous hemagglutinin N-terminal domain-containing protein [Achromobacter sp.]